MTTWHYADGLVVDNPHIAAIRQEAIPHRRREAGAPTYGHALCLAVLALAEAGMVGEEPR